MMRRRAADGVKTVSRNALLAYAALAAFASPALAAPDVVVTATRTPQSPERIGASVIVIPAAELERRQTGQVVDVLRDAPGVAFSRNGGLGAVTSVRIRGAEGDQTVVLIDGVKLNDPSQPGGGFNFANLFADDLERIEVLRGVQSTLYGSQAIGGVVNLIGRAPGGPLAASALLEAGELGTTRARASARGTFGALGLSATVSRSETDGISAFSQARGGRERDGFEQTAARLSARYALGDAVAIGAQVWWADSEVGIDGFPAPAFALADTPERSATEELITALSVETTSLGGRWRNRIVASQTTTDRDSLNPALSFPLTFTARGRNERIEWLSTFDATDRLQIVGGAETETASLRTASPSVANPNPRPLVAEADLNAVWLQAQASPTDWLTATLGVRRSDNDRFGEAINVRATLAAAFNNGSTIVRASAADGFKAPTPFQLFSSFGNATLLPEEATSIEAGVEQALLGGALRGGLTWFRRDATNQIDFISCFGVTSPICVGRPFGTYDNIQKVKAEGVEATLDWRPTERLTLTAGYASLDARNRTGGSANFGRLLPRRPETMLSVSAGCVFAFGLDVSATWTSIGDSFDDPANRRLLPGYELIALRASQKITDRWTAFARVENASDETYETTTGYGSPPRQAFIGVRAAL